MLLHSVDRTCFSLNSKLPLLSVAGKSRSRDYTISKIFLKLKMYVSCAHVSLYLLPAFSLLHLNKHHIVIIASATLNNLSSYPYRWWMMTDSFNFEREFDKCYLSSWWHNILWIFATLIIITVRVKDRRATISKIESSTLIVAELVRTRPHLFSIEDMLFELGKDDGKISINDWQLSISMQQWEICVKTSVYV